MKKWKIFVLIVLAVALFFILRSGWNRYTARELAEEYIRTTYKGVDFKLDWPRYYSSFFTDLKEYHVVGESVIQGRKFQFLVIVNHSRTKVKSSNFVMSRFNGEISAYLKQRLQPVVGDAELKVGTNGGSFLHRGDAQKYYLSSLKEVLDKFESLPDVGIEWKSMEELTNEQFYNICTSLAELLKQQPFSIGGISFRYFTEKHVMILDDYGLEEISDTPQKEVMKKIHKNEIAPEGQKPRYSF